MLIQEVPIIGAEAEFRAMAIITMGGFVYDII
jgi:hypothetical protein